MSVLEIVVSVLTIIGTLAGAFGGILSAFYKSNKQAKLDYEKLEFDYNEKINALRQELKQEFKDDSSELKQELQNISDKIDKMANRYVSNENFKTYAESINQLFRMNSDRMERIENTLDDIREDINSLIRSIGNK